MVWNTRTKLEDIEGLKPELDALKTGVSKIDAIEAQGKEFKSTLDTIRETLEALKLNGKPAGNGEEGNNNGGSSGEDGANNRGGGSNDNGGSNEPTSFLEDENKAFNERARPIAVEVMKTRAELAYDRVSRRHADWDKYKDEIMGILKKSPLTSVAQEEYIENTFLTVWAKHKREDEAKAAAQLEGGGGSAGGAGEQKKPQLTDEEKKYAKTFKMTEEQFLASKSKLKFGGAA